MDTPARNPSATGNAPCPTPVINPSALYCVKTPIAINQSKLTAAPAKINSSEIHPLSFSRKLRPTPLAVSVISNDYIQK